MRSTNKGLIMTLDFLQVPTLDDGAVVTLPAHLEAGELEVRRGVRVTEETDAARALVAVVGLGYSGLSSAMALRRASAADGSGCPTLNARSCETNVATLRSCSLTASKRRARLTWS
jgi:hypothetical protein